MTLSSITQFTYNQVGGLILLLESNGVIKPGEAEKFADIFVDQRTAKRRELRRKFWESIQPGWHIKLASDTGPGVNGIVIAKSAEPFESISFKALEKARGGYKLGEVYIERGYRLEGMNAEGSYAPCER